MDWGQDETIESTLGQSGILQAVQKLCVAMEAVPVDWTKGPPQQCLHSAVSQCIQCSCDLWAVSGQQLRQH